MNCICQYIDEQGNAFWITEYISYQIYDAEKESDIKFLRQNMTFIHINFISHTFNFYLYKIWIMLFATQMYFLLITYSILLMKYSTQKKMKSEKYWKHELLFIHTTLMFYENIFYAMILEL